MGGDFQVNIPIEAEHDSEESGCLDLLCDALKAEPGIHDLSMDLRENRLRLRYDPGLVSLARVQTVARRLGVELGSHYDRCALRVHGMRCTDCMHGIENRLSELPGLKVAFVNPATETISIEYDTGQTDLKTIEEGIALATGYRVRPPIRTRAALQQEHRRESSERGRMVSLTIACFLMLSIGWVGENFVGLPEIAALILYLGAYLSGGYYSAGRAVRQLRTGEFSMDSLMLMAALGAAALGDWPEGGVLLFLFSLSNTLESLILGRTRRAIEAMMDLNPDEAVVRRNGAEKRVSVEQLRIGDVVIVRPGERIPADGSIRSGRTTVDASAMTGESIPVEKGAGDPVFAGTLNQEGAIEIDVSRLAGDTTLSRIVRLVEEAQSERAQSHRFAEWFGHRYTLAVVGTAIGTLLVPWIFMGETFSVAIYRAMTVVVVASPCAVVISIPAAILSAIACAARNGVLFKGGLHLEQAARLRAVAFDKTGTLTIGRPQLVGHTAADGRTADEILALAASAGSLSEHPLSKAVVDAARLRHLRLAPVSNVEALVGRGVRAEVAGAVVQVGRASLFEDGAVPQSLASAASRAADEGKTAVFIGDKAKVFGMLVLADTLRPSSEDAVRRLRRLGLERIVMLTGDNRRVAEAIGAKLGIDLEAELMPEDKLRVIRELRGTYGEVAMVGDGINDAPSLAAANLGVSLGGTGTDVALETADIVLMSDDLRHLAFAIDLSRRAVRIIRQNLIFAFGVMAALLGVTYFGTLPLPLAVVGHEGSTVLVILNGLRLLTRRPDFVPAPNS